MHASQPKTKVIEFDYHFRKTIKNRVLWVWDDYTNFGSTGSPNNNSATNPERVQLEPFLEFIKTIPI